LQTRKFRLSFVVCQNYAIHKYIADALLLQIVQRYEARETEI